MFTTVYCRSALLQILTTPYGTQRENERERERERERVRERERKK